MLGKVSSRSVECAGYFKKAGAIDDGRRRRKKEGESTEEKVKGD